VSLFDNIPSDIRAFDQWINWRYDVATDAHGNERITKIPIRPLDGKLASVTDPRDWTTFDQARHIAETTQYTFRDVAYNYGLGYVFSKSDPFTGVDLDAKENADTERQSEIFRDLDSYSELSPSGVGLHIITRASLPGTGRRSGGIECYDTSRYFTFTGNVYHAVAIADRQQQVNTLWDTLGKGTVTVTEATGTEYETLTDQQVIDHASTAVNGAKFKRLWEGEWGTDYGTQSQSEADQALVDIIQFYSRNKAQITRMFRNSGLGRRDKAQRNDYVRVMVRKSFDKTLPQYTIAPTDGGPWFDATKVEPWTPTIDVFSLPPMQSAIWQPSVVTQQHYPSTIIPQPEQSKYDLNDPGRPLDFLDPIPPMYIPGIVGELVAHTWNMSVHQIAEVAVASALSTMSLICSRSYRHGSMGLSLYLMLLAQTSTGKSFAYQANDQRFNAMIRRYRMQPPHFQTIAKARAELLGKMVMGEMGSAQGLAQQMPIAPATLAHLDEYVDQIRMMAQPNPPANLAQISTELLRLMEMSGPGRMYRGRKYSKRSTTASEEVDVISASLTILATGTPEQFYDELSPSLFTRGILPRFTILEYNGGLTKRNESPLQDVPESLTEHLTYVFDKAMNLQSTMTGATNEFINVMPADKSADDALKWFDNVCYRQVEEANKTGTNMAGIWSRAKDHVRQIASLIAIGVTPDVPKIEREHVGIAIAIVRPTVDKIAAKVTTGQTGTGDDRLEGEIKRFASRWIVEGWPAFAGYANVKKDIMEAGFIQTSVMRNYCMHLAVFKNNRAGSAKAFDSALDAMCRYGTFLACDGNGQKCLRPNMDHFRNIPVS
jgi:NrS-1  polymerase HBD domain